MIDRKETTKLLSEHLEHYINPKLDPRIYWAKEVTFNYGTPEQFRVDYMKYIPLNNSVSGLEHGDVYCFEIKSCMEDFNSGHGLNFVGDYNYVVCPNDMENEVRKYLPYNVGIMVPTNDKFNPFNLTIAKKAHRTDRKKPLLECIFMMYRSFQRDERKGH